MSWSEDDGYKLLGVVVCIGITTICILSVSTIVAFGWFTLHMFKIL